MAKLWKDHLVGLSMDVVKRDAVTLTYDDLQKIHTTLRRAGYKIVKVKRAKKRVQRQNKNRRVRAK